MNITVTEYKDNGGYVAHIEEYDIYGDGNTPTDAIQDVIDIAKDVAEIARQDGKVEVADKLIQDIRELVK